MNALKVHLAALDEVEQTARGGNDDLHTLAQRAYLAFDARAAVHWEYAQIGRVFRKVGEVAADLQAEFARRRDDERLRLAARGVGALDHGQTESGSLAGASLCECHNVAVFVEQVGDYFFLHRHRVLKTHILDCVQQVFSNF